MKNSFRLAAILTLASPLLAFAQTGINTNAITPYSQGIIDIINQILVPVIIAISFIVFLWGIYKYFIAGAANESEKGEGRTFALWGIIGFVIIISVWGLVNLVLNTFGLTPGQQAPTAPTFNPGGGTDPADVNNSPA
jgi:hypothetical protein